MHPGEAKVNAWSGESNAKRSPGTCSVILTLKTSDGKKGQEKKRVMYDIHFSGHRI